MKHGNILVICSDEHRRSALGCYGHPFIKTPNLDRLAQSGTRFNRAYTPSPTCVSARACLATGLNVHQNCCWSSAQPYHGQFESWMHKLRGAGHRVVSIGKLHFRSSSDDNGFSEEIIPMHLANDGKGWPQALLRRPMMDYGEVAEMAENIGPGESSYTEYDRQITAEACHWLESFPKENAGKPWALSVSFISPHYPLTAPETFYDLYADVEMPAPFGRSDSERSQHPVIQELAGFWAYDEHFDDVTRAIAQRSYFGLCSFLDDNIGKVLASLRASGDADNTTVIYITDHGELLGNHGFWGKCNMYEDSVGIPLILAGPGVPVGTNDTPVSLIDISATIVDAAGIGSPKATDSWRGRSLRQIASSPEPQRYILSEYHDGGSPTGIYMIQRGAWKYVHYADGYPAQLFNLERDPCEMNDLGEDPDFADILGSMRALLGNILDPEAVNAQAFDDQAALLRTFGGAEAVKAMPSFGYTPVGK